MSSTINQKCRNFCIVVHEEADCFKEVEEICKNLQNCVLYAGILHYKDRNEDGSLKKKHYHVCLEFVNPLSFSSIAKKFKGAHIEQMRYRKSSYTYLLHESVTSVEKTKYELEEIFTNSFESVKSIIASEEAEPFLENMFMRYLAQGVNTVYRFVSRFGMSAYAKYWKTYERLIQELSRDSEMYADYETVCQELDNELPF